MVLLPVPPYVLPAPLLEIPIVAPTFLIVLRPPGCDREAAGAANLNRCSGNTRSWYLPQAVSLNPEEERSDVKKFG